MTDAATPTDTTPVEPQSVGASSPTSPVQDAAPKAAAAKPTPAKPAAPKKREAKKTGAKPAPKKSSSSQPTKASKAAPEVRSAAQIQADIDAAQARLASRVDELSDRLNPQHLAEEAVGGVKRVFVHEDGTPKGKPIAIVAGGLTALLVLRKIFHR